MHDQLSSPGIGLPPARKDRLFFAAQPNTTTAGQIATLAKRLRDEYGLTGKPLAAARLHVTLHWLGDHVEVPHLLVALASKAASTIALPSFSVRFDRVLSFSGNSHTARRHAFVLKGDDGAAGIVEFHRALLVALRNFGLPTVTRSYTPHVTLLYDEQSIAERLVEPVSWTVKEFVLMHSAIGENRPYSILGRWPLQYDAKD